MDDTEGNVEGLMNLSRMIATEGWEVNEPEMPRKGAQVMTVSVTASYDAR